LNGLRSEGALAGLLGLPHRLCGVEQDGAHVKRPHRLGQMSMSA
jgi:hypothetical protein